MIMLSMGTVVLVHIPQCTFANIHSPHQQQYRPVPEGFLKKKRKRVGPECGFLRKTVRLSGLLSLTNDGSLWSAYRGASIAVSAVQGSGRQEPVSSAHVAGVPPPFT